MVRGQYIAGTGMLLQRRLMETITNNITNADTTSYKKEFLVSHSFDEVMLNRINDTNVVGQTTQTGPLNLGTQIDQLYVNFQTGNMEATERSTDFALEGDGFFVVDTPEGERYTRCGAFYLNYQGYLVTAEGNMLLGENGPIQVGTTEFMVDEIGNVSVDGGAIDRIRVVAFEDNNSLRKQGGNLYFSVDEPIGPANEFKIMQGYLESSNVDIAREMVDMLSVYRVYETNQKILTMIDETVGKAVNEIGRLR